MNLPQLKGRVVALDLETTGLSWLTDDVFGVAMAVGDKDYYWDIRLYPRIMEWLKDEFHRCELWVNHNIKFDHHFLLKNNIPVPDKTWCTMTHEALIDEHQHNYDLDSVAKRRLGLNKYKDIYKELAEMFGGKPTRNAQMGNLHLAPEETVRPYAEVDARRALQLYQWQMDEVERQDLHQVSDLERRLYPCLVEQEHAGIKINEELAEETSDKLGSKIKTLKDELNTLAGFEVNPNPSNSIKKLFKPELIYEHPKKKELNKYKLIDGTIIKATKAGNPSLDADALSSMSHPGGQAILKVRKLIKMRDTFIMGHVIGHSHNGRVYPNINQTRTENDDGTGTGRLSYSRPALQQIPARDREMAAIIRPIFLPDDGQGWSYGDLDQVDFRIFGHYLNNHKINEMYRKDPNTDFHQMTSDLTGVQRGATAESKVSAKMLNLAQIFNIGSGSLAQNLGLPIVEKSFIKDKGRDNEEVIYYTIAGEEAQAVIDQYHRMVPGIPELTRRVQNKVRKKGYIKTLLGRRIRFPREYMIRKSAGLLYQASAADVNKEIVIRLHHWAKENDGRFILNIHDESSLSLPYGMEHKLKEAKEIATDWKQLRIPMGLNFTALSSNWWDSTQAEEVTR